MRFKIRETKREQGIITFYGFLVQEENYEDFYLEDLVHYMESVSSKSRHYVMRYYKESDEIILSDSRARGAKQSILTLEDTLITGIKKLKVRDRGIGTLMVNQFLNSIQG